MLNLSASVALKQMVGLRESEVIHSFLSRRLYDGKMPRMTYIRDLEKKIDSRKLQREELSNF